jgi:hypothetical protein
LYKFTVYYDENRNKKQKRLKTENMKTTMKQLAAVTLVALLLLGGNGYAKGTQTKASSQETETSLQLEKWMTDANLWDSKSTFNFEIGQETETGLSLENWMTKADAWNLNANFSEEAESMMEVENWMTSEKIWNIENKTGETQLALEKWMVNENVWNR